MLRQARSASRDSEGKVARGVCEAGTGTLRPHAVRDQTAGIERNLELTYGKPLKTETEYGKLAMQWLLAVSLIGMAAGGCSLLLSLLSPTV